MAIINALIRIRRGHEADFDEKKMKSGELAVADDAPVMWFCWKNGKAEKIALKSEIIGSSLTEEQIKEALDAYLSAHPIEITQASDEAFGGIKASPKDDDYTIEVKIGLDGKLYVPEFLQKKKLTIKQGNGITDSDGNKQWIIDEYDGKREKTIEITYMNVGAAPKEHKHTAEDIMGFDEKLDKNQGTENSGNILMVGTDGNITPLKLGPGLKIENGMLIVDSGSGESDIFTITVLDDGTLKASKDPMVTEDGVLVFSKIPYLNDDGVLVFD